MRKIQHLLHFFKDLPLNLESRHDNSLSKNTLYRNQQIGLLSI